MPPKSAVTTLSALGFMGAAMGLLMVATLMWCLTLAALLALVAIRRPLRVMAGARP